MEEGIMTVMYCISRATMIAKDLLFSFNKQGEKACWKSIAPLFIMHTQTYQTTAAQKAL